MNRRDFLAATLGTAAAACTGIRGERGRGSIQTVLGSIAPAALGTTLPHEHILVDFTPAAEIMPGRYDREEVIQVALPHLREIRALGVKTLIEATPAYLGRDPVLMARLSASSGLQIITNTGYYGARDDVHLPDHARSDRPDEIARRWIREWREGIDGTDIRPGFMKIGVDRGALSEIDAGLVRAAALTHLETGLTIAAHTGPAEAAFEELEILQEEKVHPSAWIWVHAHVEEDLSAHVDAARRGGWVEFDGISPETIDLHIELLQNMKQHRLLERVLVSQDAGWYRVGEPGGGEFRGYAAIVTDFVPALLRAGFTENEVDQLMRVNPAEAFQIRVRSLAE